MQEYHYLSAHVLISSFTTYMYVLQEWKKYLTLKWFARPNQWDLTAYIPVLPWFTAWGWCSTWWNGRNGCTCIWSTIWCKWDVIQSDISLKSRTAGAFYYYLIVHCADQVDLRSSPNVTLLTCIRQIKWYVLNMKWLLTTTSFQS